MIKVGNSRRSFPVADEPRWRSPIVLSFSTWISAIPPEQRRHNQALIQVQHRLKMVVDNLYPVPGAIAVLLASHGLYKGSLSRSGAIAAFLVGYGHLANPLKLFGVSMIAFYLLGSRATKVRCEAQLQESPPCTAWTS
jgi:hypothetical protein